jgi:hypothetical protein
MSLYKEVHLPYEPGHVIPRLRNLTEEKSCVIIFEFPTGILKLEPITVATWSKAWTVFIRSSAGIVGSNPTEDMDECVCVYSVCVVLCVSSGLATGWSLVQGALPTV